jgi:trans-aconitate methyltransferase
MACHVCHSPDTVPIEPYGELGRVTSDCKPWPVGGRLEVCRTCGCAVKIIDDVWRLEVEQVYASYTLYYQAEGAEQAVFEASTGVSSPRSVRLLDRLRSTLTLQAGGRLLDVGCGNGAFLRAFSQRMPGWALSGLEQSDRARPILEAIPGYESLHSGSINSVPGVFDMVSLIHVLEHIPDPRTMLGALRGKIKDGGWLLIQVPDCSQNAFDLLVVDHSTHFTPQTVADLVRSCGYETVVVASDWVSKEITVVAQVAVRAEHFASSFVDDPVGHAGRSVEWLRHVSGNARELASGGSFALFGTSIAAMWLLGTLGDAVDFFVDEDPQRVGKTLMGRPVYHPRDVPSGSQVFIALPSILAESIRDRVAGATATYHLPPRGPGAINSSQLKRRETFPRVAAESPHPFG